MHALREEGSTDGQRIRLSIGRGGYRDARPYYTVAVVRPDGSPSSRTVRYTPFLHRAEVLFERFLDDVTEPRALAERPVPPFDPRRDLVRWAEMPACPTSHDAVENQAELGTV